MRCEVSGGDTGKCKGISGRISDHSTCGGIGRMIENGARINEERRIELNGIFFYVEVRDCVCAEARPEQERVTTVPSDQRRANDALDVGVLPRRARCRNGLLDSHHLEAIAERLTI